MKKFTELTERSSELEYADILNNINTEKGCSVKGINRHGLTVYGYMFKRNSFSGKFEICRKHIPFQVEIDRDTLEWKQKS